jgi:hypothetical protein
MPQGKCAFCGTFVTSGGTALGKHSVACTACTPLAIKWLEKHPDETAVPAGGVPEGGEPADAG